MKKIRDVIGPKEASKEIVIGKDTVYIHSNIRTYEYKDEKDIEKKSELYIYDEIQMTKDEYLDIKQKELRLLSNTQSSTEDLLQEIILKLYS